MRPDQDGRQKQRRLRTAPSRDVAPEGQDRGATENVVVLVGRVSVPPETRTLPSGDELATFRLVVPRTGPRRGVGVRARNTVDVIDIACWTARTRRGALRLQGGEMVRVEGALRRRFFRAGGGTASRCEVEAVSVRIVRTPRRPVPLEPDSALG
jgi:single-strand DNA-binding protein